MAEVDKIPPERKSEPLPANTTEEQQIVTAGQRVINLIWENTQSQIAKVAVYTSLGINSIVILSLIILRHEISSTLLAVILASLGTMNTTMGIIIGFYFSRTNHSAIGGVGRKESPSETGTR